MSGAVYGGDEVGAVVFDIGHNSIRAGYGGEDCPKIDLPSTVGVWFDSEDEASVPITHYNIGHCSIRVWRPEMDLTCFLKDGMIENWDMFENVLDHIYYSSLKAKPRDHPVLLSEPPWITSPKREEMAELMFEKYEVPAAYLAKNASLVAYANGRPTCLVVDSGASHTSAVPVHDGYVLTQAVVKSPVGGDYLSEQCRIFLQQRGIEIVPPSFVASKENVRPEEAPSWQRKDVPYNLTDSWFAYMIKEVMQDFQSAVLQVSDSPYDEEIVKTMPTTHYEFPTGYHRDFAVERFKIPEPLFNPTNGAKAGIQPILGVGSLVTTSVGMCDMDVRPSMRLKIVSVNGPAERKFASWVGGSILSSLGTFQQMWVSKQEYEEGGKAIVHTKCL